MRWMRCSECGEPLMWVPRPDGRRIGVGVNQVPDGDVILTPQGVAVSWGPLFAPDVPRYATHAPCPKATA